MKVKFLEDGESPETGAYTKNEEREVNTIIGRVFVSRHLAEAVKPEPEQAAPVAATKKKEANANGGE